MLGGEAAERMDGWTPTQCGSRIQIRPLPFGLPLIPEALNLLRHFAPSTPLPPPPSPPNASFLVRERRAALARGRCRTRLKIEGADGIICRVVLVEIIDRAHHA